MSNPITRRAPAGAATATMLRRRRATRRLRCRSLARPDVYDRSAGEKLPVYPTRPQLRVGRPGNEYAVRIRNGTDRRLLAVVSVDGVNVVTRASRPIAGPVGLRPRPGDYVNIQAAQGPDRTAAFYFSDRATPSRAHRQAERLGVIGVALFREREVDGHGGSVATRGCSAAPAGSAAGAHRSDAAAGPGPPNPAAPRARQDDAGCAQMRRSGTVTVRREYSPGQQVECERASPTPDEPDRHPLRAPRDRSSP